MNIPMLVSSAILLAVLGAGCVDGSTARPAGSPGGAQNAVPADGGSTGTGAGNPALKALALALAPGWNLGNSFDASPQVTSWGNPVPSQTLIAGVKAAGFNSLRIPVTWTNHLGPAPSYAIDPGWMAAVVQTAQWASDVGLYVFINTHHDGDGQWLTFPADPTGVAAEVAAVWGQIASAFQDFDDRLMFECFNEPHSTNGASAAQTQGDLNLYLEACVNAIRGTGGNNATRVIMIQPVGASPSQSGIGAMLRASIIGDPNLIVSIHTYEPTKFGLGTTPYAWGSAGDYSGMASSVTQLLGWLPDWAIIIGEWGSMGVQAPANRAAHALAYAQDTTAAGMCPIWWDNGGSGNGSYAILDRNTGAPSQPAIVGAIMTGTQNGLAAPGVYATLDVANP